MVAGGASGTGLKTARVLALRNVHVIIAVRNREAANEAKHLILKDYETARVDVLKLDVSSINSIKAFVNYFNSLNLPLNILIYLKMELRCNLQQIILIGILEPHPGAIDSSPSKSHLEMAI
ncbi:unnamed protein product [Camellia sinensis]